MAEYTPSGDEVRRKYVVARPAFHPAEGAGAEFDRFLARVRREAWDEGFAAFEFAYKCDHADPWPYLRDNPYRVSEGK